MNESNPSPVERVAEELSREAEQDRASARETHSYLATADSAQLEQREREYRDLEKHWARGVWLRYAQVVANENKRKIRYLGLPAYYRLDIALFQKHDLLDSTPAADGSTILTVAAFETDPSKYARMISQSPTLQLLGLSPIEKALTDRKNKYYSELLKLFPFDVINLDLTTSLTPQHEGPYSTVMRAIEEVMMRQAPHEGAWALFITFRNVADEWEATARDKFLENLQQNLEKYPEVRDTFVANYHCASVNALAEQDVRMAITQSVIKWLVDRAHYYGMQLRASRSYYYQRYDAPAVYTITKVMLRFERGTFVDHAIPMKESPRQTWMNQDLLKCIERNQRRDIEETLYNCSDAKISALQAEIDELIKLADVGTGAAENPGAGN